METATISRAEIRKIILGERGELTRIAERLTTASRKIHKAQVSQVLRGRYSGVPKKKVEAIAAEAERRAIELLEVPNGQ